MLAGFVAVGASVVALGVGIENQIANDVNAPRFDDPKIALTDPLTWISEPVASIIRGQEGKDNWPVDPVPENSKPLFDQITAQH